MRVSSKDAAMLKLDIFRTIMSTQQSITPELAAIHANCVFDRLYGKEPKKETTK